MSEWIDAFTKLPDPHQVVLVHHKDFGVQTGYLEIHQPVHGWIVWVRNSKEFCLTNVSAAKAGSEMEVTHWMNLPKAPEQKRINIDKLEHASDELEKTLKNPSDQFHSLDDKLNAIMTEIKAIKENDHAIKQEGPQNSGSNGKVLREKAR